MAWPRPIGGQGCIKIRGLCKASPQACQLDNDWTTNRSRVDMDVHNLRALVDFDPSAGMGGPAIPVLTEPAH